MRAPLPEEVRLAVKKTVHDAQMNGIILDAYAAAERILEQFPNANFLLTDVVDCMIECHPSIEALELSPPALILEIIVPAEADLIREDVSNEFIKLIA